MLGIAAGAAPLFRGVLAALGLANFGQPDRRALIHGMTPLSRPNGIAYRPTVTWAQSQPRKPRSLTALTEISVPSAMSSSSARGPPMTNSS